MVDPADYEWLRRYTWYAEGRAGACYACTRCNGKSCYMHRMLMNPPKGKVVDHKNRNGLDNHRINLRNGTVSQNGANSRQRTGVSQFRGVRPHGTKWQAYVGYQGRTIPLGVYDDPAEAARVRDRKAVELHGEFARLNFPEEHRIRYVDMQGRITARSGARARLRCTPRRSSARVPADCVRCTPCGSCPFRDAPWMTCAAQAPWASESWSRVVRNTEVPWHRHPADAAWAGSPCHERPGSHTRAEGYTQDATRATHNERKTPRPAPRGYGPRICVAERWAPRRARGPPPLSSALHNSGVVKRHGATTRMSSRKTRPAPPALGALRSPTPR